MLAVIDYGSGNLGSLLSALQRRGVPFRVVEDAAALHGASAAILPGDGAFGATMQALRSRGLDTAIVRLLERERPFLGICVGMQLLFERSTEHGSTAGFGIFAGEVQRFEPSTPRIPHMGWNDLVLTGSHPITRNIATGEYVYFLHSYRVLVGAASIASATYGDQQFTAIAAHRHIVATQFHPEKSQRTGGKILDNFLAMAEPTDAH